MSALRCNKQWEGTLTLHFTERDDFSVTKKRVRELFWGSACDRVLLEAVALACSDLSTSKSAVLSGKEVQDVRNTLWAWCSWTGGIGI